MAKEKQPRMYTVSGEGRSITVPAVDIGQAIQKAAAVWHEDWKWLTGMCVVSKSDNTSRPVCRMCQNPFGKAGDPPGYCTSCELIRESIRRERARIKGPDRRARYGH